MNSSVLDSPLLSSPIEDAQTAMSLVNLKLEKGLAYGDVVLGGQVRCWVTLVSTYLVTPDSTISLVTSLTAALRFPSWTTPECTRCRSPSRSRGRETGNTRTS